MDRLLSPRFIDRHVLPIELAASFLVVVMIMLLPSVHGCMCSPPPDTAAERATNIMTWTNLAVIARFTNETHTLMTHDYGPSDLSPSSSPSPEPELEMRKTQVTRFIVKEILYNNPNTPLENSVEVQPDGTMVVHKSTVTECCVCGRQLPAQDIGNDYLLTIHKYGDRLSTCGYSCRIDNVGLCNETATELSMRNPANTSNEPLEMNGSAASSYSVHFALSFFLVQLFAHSS